MKNFKYLFLFVAICMSNLSNAQDPTVQASNLSINTRTQSSFSISWSRGNGEKCLVVVKPFSNSYSYPVDGAFNDYASSSTYGLGDNLGNSNYVVYDGTGTSMTISGLSASTQYAVMVYEYNITTILSTNYYYYLNSVLSGNYEASYTLCTQPTTNASALTASSINYTTASLSWSTGNSTYTLCALDNYSSGSSYANPTDGIAYSASTVHGSGTSLLGDNHVVYTSTGTSVNVSNLLPATTYRATIFEFCGSSTGATWNYMSTSGDDVIFTTLNNPPTLNSISNRTICQNSSATVVNLAGISDGSSQETQTVSVTASSSNTALIPNGNISISYTNPNSTGTLTFTPAVGQYGTSNITVTVNDGFTATNTTTRTFTVTVNPFPSAAGVISSSSTVCKNGSNYIFTVPAILNATSYTWSFPAGTVIVSGSTTNSVTVNFPSSMPLTSGTVSVFGTNTFGCGNGVASSKTISFDSAPTVSAAGADQIICNGTTQLQGNLAAVGTGIWTVGSGSAAFNNASQNNTNVTGISSGQTVLLNWTISNGVCPSSVDQVSITFNPAAPQCLINADFIASNTAPCLNAAVNFTDNSVGATGWTWNFGPNASPTSSTLQNPTNVTFNTAGPQTISLTVTGPNGSDGETKNAYINVIATPTAASAISGDNSVCEGDNQILYSINNIANATDYIWTLPSGATINSGVNTESISIDYNLGSTSGALSVQGSNVCGVGTISNLSITVNPLPGFAGTISGNTTVCQGETGVVYSISAITNATGYDWTVPSGATIVQNNGTSITVDFSNNAITGDVIVFGTNTCGDGSSRQITITVNPLPGSVGIITGQTIISNCPVSFGIEYAIDSVANATSYLWNTPSGSTIISGNFTDTILVDFAFGANSGNIAVMPQNACGNGNSNSISIVVDDPVSQSLCLVTVDDNSTHNILVWEKSNSLVLESFNIYREVTTNNYSLIGNVHKDSLSEYHDLTADPNTTSYKYKITALDTCGNESPMSDFHSTIHLQDLGSGNLQWTLYDIQNAGNPVDFYEVFRDDSTNGSWNSISSTIPGGNSTFTDVNYNLFSNPSYRVDVIWATTCTSTRAGVNTSRSNVKNSPNAINGINDQIATDNIKLFPNPANESFQIAGVNSNSIVTVYNSVGQVIYSENIPYAKQIDISQWSSGIYTVKIEYNQLIKISKLIKN